ncbi:unnamed protein product [Schistosoma margrebowiei]|uniref:Uncharacterized protein n=1 Tax=Schistosoma margrebowiei TaxID=48269 RepID=A0A183LQJ8_9TREM|nr:unnamed protein product [Schistosoma margrebowiei]
MYVPIHPISMETLDKIQERKNKKTAINNSRTQAEKVKAKPQYTEANKPAPVNPMDNEAGNTDISIAVTPSTIEEIRIAIRQIKSRKAAPPDNILAGFLKSDTEVTSKIIHVLFKIWEEEQVPTDWKEGHIIKILKKGNLR